MLGTVYAATVVRARDAPPRGLLLVDLEDGTRVMRAGPVGIAIGTAVREVPGSDPVEVEAA